MLLQSASNQCAEFAWPGGDRPGEVAFHHAVPDAAAQAIMDGLAHRWPEIAEKEVSLRALQPVEGPVGRYRLATRRGAWFVRVSARWGNPSLEQAITEHLGRCGVAVNPLLVAGASVAWQGRRFRADVRPLIEGRHFNGSVKDMQAVARALADCHRAFRSFARAHEVRASAAARFARLARLCDRLSEAVRSGCFELFGNGAAWAAAHRDWLAELLQEFDRYRDQASQAQCVHGEVHPGNVLFLVRDGAAVLVDFEESVHLFLPPVWDVAFMAQRFCLRDEPTPAAVRERLASFHEAYGYRGSSLAPMMRHIAWVSVMTIVDLWLTDGILTPVSEYEKFFALAQQAQRYAEWV